MSNLLKKIIKLNIIDYFIINKKKIKYLNNFKQLKNYFNHLIKENNQAYFFIIYFIIFNYVSCYITI
jgi:hypothetical protein